MAGQVPWGEACLAMLAMLIVLVFVLIYYCVMPIYHGLKRRKEREEQRTWENDPRWNRDTFRYMPKLPDELLNDKKYSRLAACSRSSSMREDGNNAPIVVNVNESQQRNQQPSAKPPKYSDLYDQNSASSSAKSSPPRYSSKTPSVEIHSSNEKLDQASKPAAATEPPKKVKIIKPKKKKVVPEETKPIIDGEEDKKEDSK